MSDDCDRQDSNDISDNDSGRYEMQSQGARGSHGAGGSHFVFQIGPKNQTPTVKLDFSSHPASRISFSIHSCPDTGATISIMKASIAKQKNMKKISSGISNLMDAQGVFMKVEGKVRIFVSIRGGGKKLLVEAIVSSSLADNFLLCWKDQKRLGILPKAWPYPPGSDHLVRIATEGWMSTNSPELSKQMSESGLATVSSSADIEGLQKKVERMSREDNS